MFSSVCNRPSRGRSWSPLDGGGSCFGLTLKLVGRPASPRPAGLGLAHLGLPFHRHLDPRVHEVHSGLPAQKISVSVAGGSLIHVIGLSVHLIKPTCNPWFRGNVSVSLHSWTEDVAQLVEVIGRPAWVFPSFSSFLVYYLLEAKLIQNLLHLLEKGKICMKHGAKLNLFSRSWRSK